MAQGVKKAIKPKSNTKRPNAPKKRKPSTFLSHYEKKRQVKALAGRSHEGDMIAVMSRQDREKTFFFRNEVNQAENLKSKGTIQRGGKVRRALTDKQEKKASGARARQLARDSASKAIAKKK